MEIFILPYSLTVGRYLLTSNVSDAFGSIVELILNVATSLPVLGALVILLVFAIFKKMIKLIACVGVLFLVWVLLNSYGFIV